MVGFLAVSAYQANALCFQIQKEILMSAVGFNGIADIGWDVEFLTWMQSKSNVGRTLRDIGVL